MMSDPPLRRLRRLIDAEHGRTDPPQWRGLTHQDKHNPYDGGVARCTHCEPPQDCWDDRFNYCECCARADGIIRVDTRSEALVERAMSEVIVELRRWDDLPLALRLIPEDVARNIVENTFAALARGSRTTEEADEENRDAR